MDSIEKIWPEWQVEKELGAGSFGKVYQLKREDIAGSYKSALKVITIPQDKGDIQEVLNEGMDQASATTYFKGIMEEIVKEFAMMEKLKGNTNIVSYEDHKVIPHDDGYGWDIYIRMELLTPLPKYLSQGGLDESKALKIGIDMCRALEICEKYNIIHRDIKPENIFVSELGDFKLGDFGVARTAEKTMANMSKKGTYTYMAPEVYKGEAYDLTVDLYSLGIVLYRMLNNNRAPFLPPAPAVISFSDREEALAKRLSGEVLPDPAHGNNAFKAVVKKACAFNPEERFKNATQMRLALEAAGREAGLLEGTSGSLAEVENAVAESLPIDPTSRTVDKSKTKKTSNTAKAADNTNTDKQAAGGKKNGIGKTIRNVLLGIVIAVVAMLVLLYIIGSNEIKKSQNKTQDNVSTSSVSKNETSKNDTSKTEEATVDLSDINTTVDVEYEHRNIKVVPEAMCYYFDTDSDGKKYLSGYYPKDDFDTLKVDNSVYDPTWLWGDWVLVGAEKASEITDKKVTIFDDGISKTELCIFPNSMNFFPVWDSIYGRYKNWNMPSKVDDNLFLKHDYCAGGYTGRAYFEKTGQSNVIYSTIYNTNGNYLTLGVETFVIDDEGKIITSANPYYSSDTDYMCSVSTIDYYMDWNGYILKLVYEDQVAIYVPSNVANASNKNDTGSYMNGTYWALDDEHTAAHIGGFSKNYLYYAPYYQKYASVSDIKLGKDGVIDISADAINSGTVNIEKKDISLNYLFSGDNIILEDNGKKYVYTYFKNAWTEESILNNEGWEATFIDYQVPEGKQEYVDEFRNK